jgi:UDP-N-acetylmuramyl pentapeptide phosphotransferase/UDP-N-acetylglucosamine-1-phosphate transferase
MFSKEIENWPLVMVSALVFIIGELVYFRIAVRFGIIDQPNARSSHSLPVIRGGGVIFVLAVLTWFCLVGFKWPWFVVATLLIAVVGFFDDVFSLNSKVRLLAQTICITLIFVQLSPLSWPMWLTLIAGVVLVGTVNAFNFMDGINGITGAYSLVAIGTLTFINNRIIHFTDPLLLSLMTVSIIVFLFFNYRKSARCFAGDVGSVTIALVLIFFTTQLIIQTNNFLWPLLFLVYGTDSISTIADRIRKK